MSAEPKALPSFPAPEAASAGCAAKLAGRRAGALLPLILAAVMLSGCGHFFGKNKDAGPVEDDRPANVIYGDADKLLDKKDYGQAAKKYEDVDISHPYSDQAKHAIIMAAYAYYKDAKYTEAISAGNRYLTLHPGADDAALAQNIVAMSYYDQVLDPKRDQTNARNALSAYLQLLQRYPDSRYAAQAANRIRILRNLLAANEMDIGRFYLRGNNYLAAINRFRDVVTNYQQTEQVEEALERLTEAYLALGIVNEAETAAAVLGHNFPDSSWYQQAYRDLQKVGRTPQEHAGSWLTNVWKGDGKSA